MPLVCVNVCLYLFISRTGSRLVLCIALRVGSDGEVPIWFFIIRSLLFRTLVLYGGLGAEVETASTLLLLLLL